MKKIIFIISIIFLNTSCSKDDHSNPIVESIQIPNSTVDYNSIENWTFHPNKTTILSYYNLDIEVIDENLDVQQIIEIDNNSSINTGIDVFWVHPTILNLSQNLGGPKSMPLEEQNEVLIRLTTLAQAGLLAKYGRFFAPRYRQSTSSTYDLSTDKKLQANVVATTYSDIKAAFLHYLNNYNNGNKIILAGHSQGSNMLAFLLRDLFDENPMLKDKLLVASLGGMWYTYANQGQYKGGWWKNIPLCTSANECGCISNWTSYGEEQAIPEINYGLPEFNPYLINTGLVFRAFNENQDWFLQDSEYYGSSITSLQNYIVSNASYNLGNGSNFIAFDNMYSVRQRREGMQKVVLSVNYVPLANDQRPNDLEAEMQSTNYPYWGFHTKDYNIYIWALMEQIDEKIANCL